MVVCRTLFHHQGNDRLHYIEDNKNTSLSTLTIKILTALLDINILSASRTTPNIILKASAAAYATMNRISFLLVPR